MQMLEKGTRVNVWKSFTSRKTGEETITEYAATVNNCEERTCEKSGDTFLYVGITPDKTWKYGMWGYLRVFATPRKYGHTVITAMTK